MERTGVDLEPPDILPGNPVLSLLDQIGQMTQEHVDEAIAVLDGQIRERYQRYLDPLERQRDRLAELKAFLAGKPPRKPYARRKAAVAPETAPQDDSPKRESTAKDRPDATVDKICLYLQVAGPSSIRSIAEGTNRTYQAVYLQLKNKPELFRTLPDNTWTLVKH